MHVTHDTPLWGNPAGKILEGEGGCREGGGRGGGTRQGSGVERVNHGQKNNSVVTPVKQI